MVEEEELSSPLFNALLCPLILRCFGKGRSGNQFIDATFAWYQHEGRLGTVNDSKSIQSQPSIYLYIRDSLSDSNVLHVSRYSY